MLLCVILQINQFLELVSNIFRVCVHRWCLSTQSYYLKTDLLYILHIMYLHRYLFHTYFLYFQWQQMIIRIYLFLRDEYKFIKLHNIDNCKVGPLQGIHWRTSQATGLSSKYVSRLVMPYKKCPPLAAISSQAETEVDIRNNIAQTDFTIHTNKEQCAGEETESENEVVVVDVKPEAIDIEDESLSEFHQEMLEVNQDNYVNNVSAIKKEKSDTDECSQSSGEEILGLVQTIPGFQPETLFTGQKLMSRREIEVIQSDSEKNIISHNTVLDNTSELRDELDDFRYEVPIVQRETSITQKNRLDFSQKIPDAVNEEIDFENEIHANILECCTNTSQESSDDELLIEIKRKRKR